MRSSNWKGASDRCVCRFHTSLGARPGCCVPSSGSEVACARGPWAPEGTSVRARGPWGHLIVCPGDSWAGTAVTVGSAGSACTMAQRCCWFTISAAVWIAAAGKKNSSQSCRMGCGRSDPKDHLVPIPLCVLQTKLESFDSRCSWHQWSGKSAALRFISTWRSDLHLCFHSFIFRASQTLRNGKVHRLLLYKQCFYFLF